MVRILLFSTLLAALIGCSSQTPSTPAQAPAAAPPAATPAASPAPVAQTAPAPAPAGALATYDTNVAGVAADITECKRKEGVLSVKIRFRNASTPPGVLVLFQGPATYKEYYVTAASKKYFMLQDTEGNYLTSVATGYGGQLTVNLAKDQQYVWWGKFPAPPPDVKKVTLMTRVAPPFEDIPVTDQ
jgi:hypothetical protein